MCVCRHEDAKKGNFNDSGGLDQGSNMVRGSTAQYYYGGAVTGMTTLGAATLIQGPGRQPLEHGWGDRQKPALPATRIPPKTCHKDDIVGSTGPSFCVPLINFVCFSCLYAVECDIFLCLTAFLSISEMRQPTLAGG